MKEGKKSPIANRRPGYPETFKTLRQWNLLGYVPKDGCEGDACWTNAFCDWWSVYYYKDEVRLAQGDELAEFNAKEAERKARKNEMSRRWHKRKRDLRRLEKAAESSEIIPCENPSKTIVFDVETTGLYRSEDDILQISIIDGDGNVLINEYVHPIKKYSWEEAQKINGISPEMVENAPYPEKLIPKVKGIFDSADLWISYNGEFDLKFLKDWGISEKNRDVKQYDVMREFAPIYGEWSDRFGWKWKSLGVCARYFDYSFDAHDSLEDVRATLYCYSKIREIQEDIDSPHG